MTLTMGWYKIFDKLSERIHSFVKCNLPASTLICTKSLRMMVFFFSKKLGLKSQPFRFLPSVQIEITHRLFGTNSPEKMFPFSILSILQNGFPTISNQIEFQKRFFLHHFNLSGFSRSKNSGILQQVTTSLNSLYFIQL